MNLAHIDLNLLVALDALLEERNVTRAGERIGLSQPAMSGTLGRLRCVFKDELLVRVGRRLELTPLAQELAQPVRGALELIEQTIEYRRPFNPASEERRFTIMASDYSTFLLSAPLVARLTAEAPSVSVHFMELDADAAEGLRSGAVDFVIVTAEAEMRLNYPGRLLFRDRWVCAVAADHPDVGTRLTRKQFLSLPYVTFALAKQGLRSDADVALAKLGTRQPAMVRIEGFLVVPFMLAGTRLVTLIQRRLAERVAQAANIKILPPPFPIPDLHESIFWNPRNTASPPHLWLRSLLLEIGQTISHGANHLPRR